MNTVFRKNLGVIFDACHVITCKTAKRESWVNLFIRDGSDTKEIQEMDSILARFEAVDSKLLVFGYRNRKKGSMLANLLLEYADGALGQWEIDDFVDYIQDQERMKRAVTSFYFDKNSVISVEGVPG